MEQLSSRNPRVQQLRRLVRQSRARAEAGLFVVEGAGLLAEALASGHRPTAVFVAEGAEGGVTAALARPLDGLGAPVWCLDPSVLATIASTTSPQPVLATISLFEHEPATTIGSGTSFLVVGVDIGEPGNAGTMIRTAAAAGADAVVFCDASVDVFNPKVVRSTAGALFRIPVIAGVAVETLIEVCATAGLATAGLTGAARAPYTELDLRERVALFFGSEAHGLGAPVLALLDEQVSIPMAHGVESVNVAAAAAAVCFEVSRQRH